MDILVEYLPILILSLISGMGGYLYNNKDVEIRFLIYRTISGGVMGIILLMLLEAFYPALTLKGQYAIVLLVVYFQPEKIMEIFEKWKKL